MKAYQRDKFVAVDDSFAFPFTLRGTFLWRQHVDLFHVLARRAKAPEVHSLSGHIANAKGLFVTPQIWGGTYPSERTRKEKGEGGRKGEMSIFSGVGGSSKLIRLEPPNMQFAAVERVLFFLVLLGASVLPASGGRRHGVSRIGTTRYVLSRVQRRCLAKMIPHFHQNLSFLRSQPPRLRPPRGPPHPTVPLLAPGGRGQRAAVLRNEGRKRETEG